MIRRKFLFFVLCFFTSILRLDLLMAEVPSSEPLSSRSMHGCVSKSDPSTIAYTPLVGNYALLTVACCMDYMLGDFTKSQFPLSKFNIASLFPPNCMLMYAMRIKKSRFAVCVGLGYSRLHYLFSPTISAGGTKPEHKTLNQTEGAKTTCGPPELATLLGAGVEVKRSVFGLSYADLLISLRFNSVLHDSTGGFYCWVGSKLSILKDAWTSIFYQEFQKQSGQLDRKGHFTFRPLYVSAQAGVGYGRFGLHVGYFLTPLFNKNQGPTKLDIYPLSVGFALNLM